MQTKFKHMSAFTSMPMRDNNTSIHTHLPQVHIKKEVHEVNAVKRCQQCL